MEEQWQVDRARLRRLRQQQPDWTHTQLAQELGYSESVLFGYFNLSLEYIYLCKNG